MPWGFAAAAVGTIAGAVISSQGAQSAADTQAAAANNASQVQVDEFNQIQQNLNPYMTAGSNALKALQGGLGINADGTYNPNAPLIAPFDASKFHASPGYQFQLQQGLGAINNAASARGGVFSGNTLKALNNYAQGAANQDYYNALNAYNQQQQNVYARLASQAGSGQNAAANLGGFGQNTANAISSNLIGAGNAQAAAQVAGSNAFGSGVNNLAQLAFQYGQNNMNSANSPSYYQSGSAGLIG